MTTLSTPPAPSTVSPSVLRQKLHRIDPYAGFDPQPYPSDLQGWHGDSPFFGELIRAVKPGLVLEVGTWKGQSALNMARELDRLGPGRQLVCIDTWLGAIEFLTDHDDPDRYRSLGHLHGYPTVYYQFLANVVHAGLQHVVVPFAQTSTNAARWFLQHGIGADLVYIDGSHEENDVYADLVYYWLVAKPGAVVFGDDIGWLGVRNAVTTFARENGLQPRYRDDNFWLLQKPVA